jgi:peptide/nickel transport system ATP-binding protein
VGESGCGKSTLARALAGLSNFEGRITFRDREIDGVGAIDRRYRRAVQIIFQNPDLALNPRLRVGELIGRPMKLYRLVPPDRIRTEVARLLEAVHLPASYAGRYTNQLSGGEKQRVSIARAFAARPELIICDEITSSLDVSVQAAILELLAELQRAHGTAYLFITHDLQVLQSIADDVAVMYLGALVERRTLRDALLQPPLHPYSEALLSSSPVADPTIETRRVPADGPLPNPRRPPPGCAFATRCARRLGDLCLTAPPRQDRKGHEILCHIAWENLAAVPPIWTRTTAIPDAS